MTVYKHQVKTLILTLKCILHNRAYDLSQNLDRDGYMNRTEEGRWLLEKFTEQIKEDMQGEDDPVDPDEEKNK